MGTAGAVRILVLVGLFGWLFWEQLRRLYLLWLKPDWSHGFLIPVFCLYLVAVKRRELFTGEHRGSLWGAGLMVLSVLVYGASIFVKIGYPQTLVMIPMIAGVVLLLRGWRTLRLTWFPIAFLVLAMPPPERLYREFTQPLQQGASVISTRILNTLPGASVENNGINIAYFMDDGRDGVFTVAGACSGMRSLLAFAAFGLAMAYFAPRPAWHRIAMAAFVVPVAMFCNVLRVLITGGLQMYGKADYSHGTPHALLGFAMFGVGIAIYYLFLWVLDHMFVEGPDDDAAEATA